MLTTHRRLAVSLLFCLAPSVLPRPAFAQGQPDPTLQAAHARFDEGVQFFDKGQFENARAAFLQAYALHKHPAVLINLAQTSLRSGHVLEAARYFAQYIHDSPALTPAQRAEAEKGLAEARTRLGHLDVSAPSGIAVTIDGELAGADGAIAIDVEPGAHTVKGGGETTTVTVAAGQTQSVKLAKAALGAIPPPPVPVAPAASAPPAPPPAPEPEPTPAPSPAGPSGPGFLSPPSMMTPVWVGAGVGLAGFVTAILFGVFKGAAQNSYNTQAATIQAGLLNKSQWQGACTHPSSDLSLTNACASLTSDGNDVNNDATAANVGIAIGVVGLGFAAGWYLFAPKDAAQGSKTAWPRVEPLVGPRVGGLSVGGSF
jgi:hypothetical protein